MVMKKLFKLPIAITLAALLLPIASFAQIDVDVPSVVAVDEQFTITFTIEGDKPSSFSWDCPSDFRLVFGPQTGSSSSVSIINGKRTSSRKTSYTYILMSVKEGEFTIPSASATAGKKKLSSSPRSIKVVAGGSQASSSSPSRDNGYSISSEDLFMRLTLDKNDVVLGETIQASIRLYKRPSVAISGLDGARFPSFDGFWNQAQDNPSGNIEFKREAVGDQIYEVATIRNYTLVPQQSGDLTIDSASLVALVQVRNASASSGSIFDSFFQDDYSTVRKRVSTHSATVHVRALPQPQPRSFCGGVGKFSLSGMLSRDSLSTHEATSLVLTLSGSGNLALVQAPSPSFSPDFEVYDVKTTDKGNSRVFEYPFIVRHHGDYTIPPVEVSYYDPSKGEYVTLSTPALHLKVSKAEGEDSAVSLNPSQSVVSSRGEDVRNIGTDIRYISTSPAHLRKVGVFFLGSPLFFVLLAVLLLGSALTYLILRKKAALEADVQLRRSRGASKMARKRLSQAGAYLKDDLYGAFYEELHRALLGFVSDRLALEASMQDKETISKSLVGAGVSTASAQEFVSLLDECEYARYAPNPSHEGMDSHYRKALDLISSMDTQMSHHRSAKTAARGGRGGKIAAVLSLLLVGAGFSAQSYAASPVDSLWNEGVSLYAASDWAGARDCWQTLADEGLESAPLYCNIADACFKSGDIAHAILWWKRSLKLNPSYKDARFNLSYAENFLQDKIDTVPEFFLKRWTRGLRNLVGSDLWAWMFIVFLALTLCSTLLLLLSKRSALKRTGFIAGIVSLVICLVCLGLSIGSREEALRHDEAVVVSAVSVVRSSPDSSSGADLFVLHEGTSVSVFDTLGEWTRIELADGRQGWIPSAEVEVI